MRARLWFWMALLLALPSMAQAANEPFSPANYAPLTGWNQQAHEQALAAFQASCKAGVRPNGAYGGYFHKAAWQRACNQAQIIPASREQAKQFFETQFTPHSFSPQQEAKLTGYYIPLLEGSLTQGGTYQWPVYKVPADFTSPYLTRAQIEAGALAGKGLELIWLNDPVMRFFLHIQGSGHVRLPDGRQMTLQFAAKNGQPYTALGKILIEEGHLTKQNVSLQSIRDYLLANPQRQQELMNRNASFVFFSLAPSLTTPKGAQGVPLTPQHSLAIDPAYWPYGIPIYLDVHAPKPFQRLAITQDTGSAIKGQARADWFAGLGKQAEEMVGHLAAGAQWIVLLPKP